MMEYTRFGCANINVSRIGLGAMGFGDSAWRPWVLREDEARPIIHRALEAGINFIDTCDFYSAGASETVLGNTLWECIARECVVLATKAGSSMAPHPNGRGFSRKHLLAAIDASLIRLKTDYVDVFQTHVWDPTTGLDEMIDAFDAIVAAGKALYAGAAQMPAWTFVRCVSLMESARSATFRSMQCEYNACHREAERELLPYCRNAGIAFTPFSPMARGFLCADRRDPTHATERHQSDDYTRKHYHRDGDYQVFDAVAQTARLRGATPAQVSLAWTLAQPGVTAPIIGATRVEHVDEAVAALSLRLEDEDLSRIEAAYMPRPTRGGGH